MLASKVISMPPSPSAILLDVPTGVDYVAAQLDIAERPKTPGGRPSVGATEDNLWVAKNRSLLAELEAGLRDDKSSATSLLQKCILLGGQAGSERLRGWAHLELKGYGNAETVPDYRTVGAVICIDGATFRGYITGQQISPTALPEVAQGFMTETPTLTNPISEFEELSRSPDSTVMLSPSGAQDLVRLWNHENQSGDQITRLYWKVSRSSITGIVTGVRTALAELVGELLDATVDDQPPSKQAVDAAVHCLITGDRNTVTVVGSQTTTNGNSTITVTGSSDHPTADKETWWQRWRKRGLIIGLATVVAAVAAVLQLYGWVPWK
ncbi:MAG: hypothetical protein ACRDSZ_04550 [Pseudonocardiaceae bacterium]